MSVPTPQTKAFIFNKLMLRVVRFKDLELRGEKEIEETDPEYVSKKRRPSRGKKRSIPMEVRRFTNLYKKNMIEAS